MKSDRRWKKCKAGMFRRVDFAGGTSVVRLLTSFVYRRTLEHPGGMVYHVEDINTGRRDFVGIEFLRSLDNR